MGGNSSLFSSPPPSPLCLQVYHLASVRLRDLCWKLDISSDLRGRIWTCFEHTLIRCTELMKGRHLDQLLLCSVYIMSKVRKQTANWKERAEVHHPACRLAPSHSQMEEKCLLKGRRRRKRSRLVSLCPTLQITKETHFFHDIMKCYRSQPQANSHVGRPRRRVSLPLHWQQALM